MAQIILKNIHKSYGNVDVIKGVDCTIADGEFIVIIGPSGCGKSTLLRMVAGLETVGKGEISIGERVVNTLEPAQRNIAMVFQNYALYPHMTVYGNMAYSLKIKGIPKAEIKQRVNRAAEILELPPDLLKRTPRQLSGGQRQRVAMGRAIVREPSVFLFDEPLSNLDAKLRVQMRLEIKKLQQELGVTSIYVTHDQIEAMTLGSRMMVLNAGIVEQLGTPIELYEKPATVFVAGFIGSPSMNFVEGRIGGDGKSVYLAGGDHLALPKLADSDPGRPVTVGMRPEHLRLVAEGDSMLTYTAQVVELLGADTLVHGCLRQDGEDVTVRIEGIQNIQAGERLPLSIDKGNIHIFDADTGERLDQVKACTDS
ncbi:MAG: sn-glycerol-3-phosphate import ATP-binding protein UgpC [Gammaproteobacteria bacterium]|nr:sn-glycerol-3-phosphate import ATP-binding protein UgpC [Gammaproteobacteria bacterium]